ncbi:MAG: GYD domain-containing protein [Cereibacter sphaeroides]|uniref:GYD domain-containing protein n=1 Tax=Cereibacter sphaeroides TaxID=1063 RepID=A0A2W5SAZ0_CERSP|nr:MAG: GYD domain-containing protein [Cereibacter sphaeroides]
MAHYIVTGSYTAAGMKGMLAKPSDREKAARAILEASGAKLRSFLLTTGDTDFSMIIEAPEIGDVMAGLIVVGASGAVTNLKTVQAFTADEFRSAQKKAGELTANYKAPNA